MYTCTMKRGLDEHIFGAGGCLERQPAAPSKEARGHPSSRTEKEAVTRPYPDPTHVRMHKMRMFACFDPID